ncbi:hypothetical protein [Photobacterium sp. DNB22_13_2]
MTTKSYTLLASLLFSGLTLYGCGGGGGGSTPDKVQEKPASPKQPRQALSCEDRQLSFVDGLHFIPTFDNQFGTAQLSIIDSQPENMAIIGTDNHSITVLKPGMLTIKATDTSDGYQDSETTCTIDVAKGTNTAFHVPNLTLNLGDSTTHRVITEHHYGTLHYSVDPSSQYLIDIDPSSGIITPLATGTATIHVTDSGNDYYEPASSSASVTIKAIESPDLVFAPISEPYSTNLKLLPWKISGSSDADYSYTLSEDSRTDVVKVDKESGLISVLSVGEATIDVVAFNGADFDTPEQQAKISVSITQGTRVAMEVDPISVPFKEGDIITPVVRHTIATPRYVIEGDSSAVIINEQTRLPQIFDTGSVSITAIDDSNPNYYPSNFTFSMTVTKGTHPGLAKTSQLSTTYALDKTLHPHLEGQEGTLSFEYAKSRNNNVVAINGDKLTALHAGTASLSVTDSGGRHFHPSAPAILNITINKAEHPELTIKDLEHQFEESACFSISQFISGNKGKLEVSAISNPSVVEYDAGNQCLKAIGPGHAVLTVNSGENQDYLASKSQPLLVTLNPADTKLIASNIEVTYQSGDKALQPPYISGHHGTLSYALADGADINVVRVDSASGQMTVLNAGKTTIRVTDSGTKFYQPAETSFTVNIMKAVAHLHVNYPSSSYAQGKTILPTLDDIPTGAVLRYSLIESGNSPVELINATTGELKINAAGNYSVLVSAESNNYNIDPLTINNIIAKAEHPGLYVEPFEVNFSPLKQVSLPIKQAPIGKRLYAENGSSTLLDIDSNTGLITLQDYQYIKSKAGIVISEGGNDNYWPLKENAMPTVTIHPPALGDSNRDITLDDDEFQLESRLNTSPSNENFKNLNATKVMFAGVSHFPATGEQLEQYGPGEILKVMMVPEGMEPTATNTRPVLFIAQRFDGCTTDVDSQAVLDHTAEAQPMGNYTYCEDGTTKRFLTFKMIDDRALKSGTWQSAVPIVVYRQSPVPFKPTVNGGCYDGTGLDGAKCEEEGIDPASEVVEWNRIDVRLIK